MKPISSKKVLIIVALLFALASWDKIAALISAIYQFFFNAFEPLRNCPPEGQFGVALAILGFLCVVGLRLLFDRK